MRLVTLVAGGAGFVGSHLVDLLVEQGHAVVVADNLITGRAENLSHHPADTLDVVTADVSERLPETLTRHQYHRIYHLASPASPVDYARNPLETLHANSLGTEHLLGLARRDGARFLLASTSEVYGDAEVHPQPEDYWGHVNPIGPRSSYDEGKRYAEALTVNYGAVYSIDFRIARIFNAYGPRMKAGDGRMVPSFCVQALAGQPLTVFGDGSQTRSLCYVGDLIRGLTALMETDGASGQVVNVGSPDEHTVLEIAERIIQLTGSVSAIEHRELPVDDPRRRRPVIEKARTLLGWEPSTVLDDGLRATIEYFVGSTPPIVADGAIHSGG